MPDIRKLKVLRPGLELGTVKKDRFEPAHALALWLKTCENKQDYPADSGEISAYLRGDVVPSMRRAGASSRRAAIPSAGEKATDEC